MGKLQRVIEQFKKSILNIEIKHTYYKVKQLKNDVRKLQSQIDSCIDNDIARKFYHTQEISFKKHSVKQTNKTNSKIQKLQQKFGAREDTIPNYIDNSVLNATSLTIPEDMLTLISLGPKFALPMTTVNELPLFHLIADIESILNTTDDKTIQERNRCAIVNIVQNHLSHINANKNKTPLNNFCKQAIRNTKKFLSENPDVFVLQSDKGKKMVVMYKEEYDKKMSELLKDKVYTIATKDPTSIIQRKTNEIVSRLLDLKLIDNTIANRLKSKNAICPHIYGQPKAHKHTLPLRPVVPNTTAPTYNLSKYIASILQQSFKSIYNIKDSFEFTDYINQITLPPDYVMVSFDVTSLFTNIPKQLVIRDIIMQWDNIRSNTNINLDLFLEIVEFCIDNSYFQFRNSFYTQTFGVAMGSPLSPILADIVMDTLMSTVSKKLNFTTPIMFKYVDDLFLCIPNAKIETTLNIFNAYNNHLHFTIEKESNNQLPFLDILITRNQDQSLSTEWYAKPYASGRLINYHSYHPMSMKINVAYNFMTRIANLSTNKHIKDLKKQIHEHLQRNNYPRALTNRMLCRIKFKNQPSTIPEINSINNVHRISTSAKINNSQQSLSPPHPAGNAYLAANENAPATSINHNCTSQSPLSQPEKQITYRSVPYIPMLSEAISKCLKFDFKNIQLAHRTSKTLTSILPKVKDKIPNNKLSNVVYKIDCSCNKCYVGMTKNYLSARITGHKSDVNKLNSRRNTTQGAEYEKEREQQKTALLNHIAETNHTFDFANTTVLDSTYRSSALPVLEMLHIATTLHTVNHRKDTENLSATYGGILHSIKTAKRK